MKNLAKLDISQTEEKERYSRLMHWHMQKHGDEGVQTAPQETQVVDIGNFLWTEVF